jgi:ABC-2 type transport system ATP-binding protein
VLVHQGATILLTTQYLEEADRLADDIVVIDQGRVIARGDALELKQQVGGSELFATASRADDLDAVAALLGRIAGSAPEIDRALRTVHAPTGGGARAVSQLADALADEDLEVDDLGLRQPTLDDVFLTLTGTHIEDEQEVAR